MISTRMCSLFKFLLISGVISVSLPNSVFAQATLEVKPAVEIKIQTREGYLYELEESANLNSFTPTGDVVEGTGESRSLFKPIDQAKKFYRAKEVPTDVKALIPGLNTYSLNTALVSSGNGKVSITGARVTSRDYDADDFLVITYGFDLQKQTFTPEECEVFTDFGPTILREGSFFPINEALGNLTATFNGQSFASGTGVNLSVPAEGGDIVINSLSKHLVAYRYLSSSAFRLKILDAEGGVLAETVYTGGSLQENRYLSLIDQARTLRIEPVGSQPINVEFIYDNSNRFGLSETAVGQNISTGTLSYGNDYKKFKLALEEGKELVINGSFSSGGTFYLAKSDGSYVDGSTRSNGGADTTVLGPIPKTAEYYLVFFGEPFENNAFSGSLSYLE